MSHPSDERTTLLRAATGTTRREFLKRAGAAGVAAPALAAAFGGGLAFGGVERAAAQDAPAGAGGTLVLLGHQGVDSLSPDDAGATVVYVVVAQIHNALIEQDENLQYQPVLAEALPETSPDGLTHTFKVRQGVTFHDGQPFTSADVKYTYDWIRDPANAANNAADLETVAAVETPDPQTVVVRLTQPNPAFMSLVAGKFILPSVYHAQVGEDAYKGAAIGTGPFRLARPEDWKPEQSTLLTAFDNHFRGRPKIDAVRLDVVPEDSVRYVALDTGEADSSVWALDVEDSKDLEESGRFVTYVTTQFAVNHIPLNNTNPIFADKRVRQAMLHAIDREGLRDEIFAGAATVATGNLSPAREDYYTADVPQYPYDPERAAALLDEAGWTLDGDTRSREGQPFQFTCLTSAGNQVRLREIQVIQANLKSVGIEMEIQETPTTAMLEQIRGGQADAALFGWTYGDQADPDPTSNLRSDGYNNFSQYSNPRIDELVDLGLREPDPAKRLPIYHEIQRIVADEVPFLYLLYLEGYTQFNRRVQGLPENIVFADVLYQKAWSWTLAPEPA